MKSIALVLLPALLLPVAAPAQVRKPEEPKKDKMVCRSEGGTGSRLGKAKRCMLASQWAELARLDRESIERTQNQRFNGNASEVGPGTNAFGRNN